MNSVSVIIPSYNRAHTLGRAIDSVLAQTIAPLEIIVIDDGSSDNTAEFVQQHYPTIRYIRQDNQGVSAARNLGIKQAKGDWIALLDSDDEWLTNKLETQLALAEQDPSIPLIHSDEIWIRDGVRVNQMNKHGKAGGWIFQRCLPLCAISPSASMIKRTLFDEVGLFDENLPACEDYDLWLKICSRYPVLYSEETLIKKYGGHEDQLSRLHWGMDRFRLQALDRILEQSHLTDDDRAAALTMLFKKNRILLKGARKHGNQKQIQQCEQWFRKWSKESVEQLDNTVDEITNKK